MEFLSTPEASFFVYITLFVGFLLIFDGVRQFLSREEDAARIVNRRMKRIKSGATQEKMQQVLLNANSGRRGRGLVARFSRMLRQAGLGIGLYQCFAIAVGLAFGTFLLALQYAPSLAAFAFSMAVGFGLPLVIVSAIRTQRLEKITNQLPEALDLMARGLEVGHPLSVTIGNVATEMSDPIGSEFGLIQDQISYGDEIAVAFSDFAERVDTEDVRYTSVSVSIQHGTGGNLAHVLRVLSTVVRDRLTMRKKIHAISAEGRLSAFILSVLPFAMVGIINFTSPSFYGDVKDDPMFLFFALATLSLIALQAFILVRMVRFKF